MNWNLTPAEPTDAMTDGLARQIIMWTRFEKPYGLYLHDHLRRCGTAIPTWLADLIPGEMRVPPKAAVASAIYKAMLSAAPDPLEDAELMARVASTVEREAAHVIAEKDKEIERLREALIDCGRIARAFVADDVSTDFLMTVPAEVRARITTLKAVAEAARVFRELYEMEDANANDVGGGLEDLFAALDGEKE